MGRPIQVGVGPIREHLRQSAVQVQHIGGRHAVDRLPQPETRVENPGRIDTYPYWGKSPYRSEMEDAVEDRFSILLVVVLTRALKQPANIFYLSL
jgi:hypothetical protein